MNIPTLSYLTKPTYLSQNEISVKCVTGVTMLRQLRWMAIQTPAGRAYPAPRPRTALLQMERCHSLQVRTPLI